MLHLVFGTPTLLIFIFFISCIFFVAGPSKKIYVITLSILFFIIILCVSAISFFYEDKILSSSSTVPPEASLLLLAILFSLFCQLVVFLTYFVHKFLVKSKEYQKKDEVDRRNIKKVIYKIVTSKAFLIGAISSIVMVLYRNTSDTLFPFAVVNFLYIFGVVSLNLLILGGKKSIKTLTLFFVLFLIGNSALISFILISKHQVVAAHMLFSTLSALVGLVYPLWTVVLHPERVHWFKLPIIFIIILITSVGSIYLPMKISLNGASHMHSGVETIGLFGSAGSSQYQQCRAYQNTFLFEEVNDETAKDEFNTSCSVFLNGVLSSISDSEKYCSHMTFRFWTDQLISNIYGLRDDLYGLGACRVSTLVAKKGTPTDRISKWYSIFINIVWFSALFSVMVEMYKILVNVQVSPISIEISFAKPKLSYRLIHKEYFRYSSSLSLFFGVVRFRKNNLPNSARRIIKYIKSNLGLLENPSKFDIKFFVDLRDIFNDIELVLSERTSSYLIKYEGFYFDVKGLVDEPTDSLVKVKVKFRREMKARCVES